MDASERQGSLLLIALGVVSALACALAIGAATTLVFLALEDSASAGAVARHDADCAVVAWNSGSVHCFRSTGEPVHRGAVVVVQAQADVTQ